MVTMGSFAYQISPLTTVLLSDNADGLQYSLNCLARYCEHWKLQVNTSKTEIVIFFKGKF